MTAVLQTLDPAIRTYVRLSAATATLYVLLLLEWIARTWLGVSALAPAVPVLSLLCGVAVVAHLWSLLRVVQGSDEFMRTVMAKRLLTAATIVIGFCAIWGLLGTAGLVGTLPLQLIYFGYFVVHAALIPFINADRP